MAYEEYLKRRAQQQAAKRRFEVQSGSLADFDNLLVCQPEAEQQVYARELLGMLVTVRAVYCEPPLVGIFMARNRRFS